MLAGEWIAFVAVALTVTALLGKGVWLIAQMNASLKVLVPQMAEIHSMVVEHSKQCDVDRLVLEQRVTGAEKRVTKLELT